MKDYFETFTDYEQNWLEIGSIRDQSIDWDKTQKIQKPLVKQVIEL